MDKWHGCYDGNWNGLITDESFSHPAKFANGLINRIFTHLALPKGSIVVDPFGGVGLGGVVAASRGLRWFGCELEPKFVDLAGKNFELHRRLWEQHGDPLPVIVQGDSRQLRANLAGVMADCTYITAPNSVSYIGPSADVVVSSPPFQGSLTEMPDGIGSNDPTNRWAQNRSEKSFRAQNTDYGSTPGNIANMPSGTVDAVVSSPPYSEGLGHGGQPTREGGKADDKNLDAMQVGYGSTPGNIANLKAGSVDAVVQADCVVSSPPYEGSIGSGSDKGAGIMRHEVGCSCSFCMNPDGSNKRAKSAQLDYGTTAGNIGNQTGDTFWSASRKIVNECWHILRPGGVAVFVTKDFVRKGKRVEFSRDWLRLCQSQGFVLTEWVHASLVKEDSHPSLFGDEPIVKRTERKSFFRRLAEKKGSPPIDHEDVLIMSKPPSSPQQGQVAAIVSSPPFQESVQVMDEVKARQLEGFAKNTDGSNRLSKSTLGGGYGSTPGQLGGMKPGEPPKRSS